MNKVEGTFRVGTSGISVTGSKQTYPPEYKEKSRLCYYASLLNSLEVNSTFYKIPRATTFERWALDVPTDFCFTIKLWKEITHSKDLKCDLDKIDLFINTANAIGDKKGCILVQFPGKITLEYFNDLEKILDRVQQADKHNSWKIAVELRNNSWYVTETNELLAEYSGSLVMHDIPKSRNTIVNPNAPFYYFRFHGPKGDYRGSYTDEFIHDKSMVIRELINTGKDVFAYFNNTAGSAMDNALLLKKLVETN